MGKTRKNRTDKRARSQGDAAKQRPLKALIRRSLAITIIATSAFIVYSNSLNYPFIFDDSIYITENPLIFDLGNFTELSGTRFVGYLSFALNYAAGGPRPLGLSPR